MSKKCEHERVEWFPAEPDLGYSAYIQCLDCDDTTTEWTDEVEVDADPDGFVSVQRWREPVWDEEEDDE